MTTAIQQTGFTQEAFDAFLAGRDEPAWLTDSRRAAWQAFQELPMPSRATKNGCGPISGCSSSISFDLPDATSPQLRRAPCRTPLLAAGVELGGHVVTLDSRPVAAELDREVGQARACCSAVSTSWSQSMAICCGRIFRAARVDPNNDKFAALHAACWSGGTLLYVPRSVRHRRAAALALGDRARRRRLRPHAGRSRRRRRSDAAGRNGQRDGRRAAGLHCGAIELIVGAGRPAAVRQPAELGHTASGTSPIRRRSSTATAAAMDDRRARQPAGQGESARGAGRPRTPSARSTA